MTSVDLGKLELRYECVKDAKTGATTILQVLMTGPGGDEPPHAWTNRVWSASNGHGAVDLHVLKLACTQLRAWHHEGLEMPLCVPVSLESLNQRGAAERWLYAMSESGVSPRLIDFGVTPVSGQRGETVTSNVAQLANAGARFSLLGFGIGYSSLATLKLLAVSRLEICEENVRDLQSDDDGAMIARSTLMMAKNLGHRTCVAGVDSLGVAKKVADLDADEFRGPWSSQPLTAEQVQAQGALKAMDARRH